VWYQIQIYVKKKISLHTWELFIGKILHRTWSRQFFSIETLTKCPFLYIRLESTILATSINQGFVVSMTLKLRKVQVSKMNFITCFEMIIHAKNEIHNHYIYKVRHFKSKISIATLNYRSMVKYGYISRFRGYDFLCPVNTILCSKQKSWTWIYYMCWDDHSCNNGIYNHYIYYVTDNLSLK
jgi:hypothetical protein